MAKLLKIPVFDKDDYLERLFEERGIGNTDWRHKLSREADECFIDQSKSLPQVILVSHWRPRNVAVEFGTPTDWIVDSFEKIIELYCTCPVEIAASRFKNRTRHPGHVDKSRSFDETVAWLREYDKYLPLKIGQQIVVSTVDNKWAETIKQELPARISNLYLRRDVHER